MKKSKIPLQQIEHKDETYISLCLCVFDCPNSTRNINFREWVFHVKADIGCRKGEYVIHNDKMIIKYAKEQYTKMSDNWNQGPLECHAAMMVKHGTWPKKAYQTTNWLGN